MGATLWSHYVPYQEDIERAFRELQSAVFQRGEYRKPDISGLDMLYQLDFFDISDEERDSILAEYRMDTLRTPLQKLGPKGLLAWLEQLDAAETLQSIEEFQTLLCLSVEGSASPLDFREISFEPGLGRFRGLTEEQLLHHFATFQPSRVQIDSNETIWDEISRGEGIYIIVYKNLTPDEIFFAGYSAD